MSEPWFRVEADPNSASDRPWISTSTSDDFVEEFFTAIRKSREGWNPDAWSELIPKRDWADYPNAMFGAGLPSLETQAQKSGEAAGAAHQFRKLYRGLHRHFHMVSAQLADDVLCSPALSTDRIVASGLLIRRLASSGNTDAEEVWLDWLATEGRKGVWAHIADGQMAIDSALVDPTSVPTTALGTARELVLTRLGRRYHEDEPENEDPLVLELAPISPLPAELDAEGRTVIFGYLPLPEGDNEAAPLSARFLELLVEARQAGADDYLADLPGQATDLQAALDGALDPLKAALIRPDAPSTTDVAAWKGALVAVSTDPSQTFSELLRSDGALENLLRETPLRVAWSFGKGTQDVATWWSAVVAASYPFAMALVRYQTVLVSNGPTAFRDLVTHLWLERLAHDATPPTALGSDGSDAWRESQRVHAILLRRGRAFRMALADLVYNAVLPAGIPRPDLTNIGGHPPTIGKIGAELGALIALGSWSPSGDDARLKTVHDLLLELQNAVRRIRSVSVAAMGDLAGLTDLMAGPVRDALQAELAEASLVDAGLNLTEPLESVIFLHPTSRPTTARLREWASEAKSAFNAAESVEPRALMARRRYDPEGVYAAWLYVKLEGRDACETGQILWSRRTEPFMVAAPMDILGLQAAPIAAPDIAKILEDLPKLKEAGAVPSSLTDSPPGSSIEAGKLPKDSSLLEGAGGMWINGIPVHFIIAFILFQMIFAILSMIPGFSWMSMMRTYVPAGAGGGPSSAPPAGGGGPAPP